MTTIINGSGSADFHTPLPVAEGGTGSATGAPAFPSGTRMLFQQTAAPTGWTKDTTAAINDGALRTVTGSASTGGTAAFTTAFTSRTPTGTNAASGSTSLSIAQMPSHTHVQDAHNHTVKTGVGAWPNVDSDVSAARSNHGVRTWTPGLSYAATATNQNTGSGSSHNHAAAAFSGSAMDFAVKYYDVIIASKD
tara:strand:+ start:161 stop:739 length:579 start_codon:yes stop_codon:yes gene_type:complete